MIRSGSTRRSEGGTVVESVCNISMLLLCIGGLYLISIYL